MLYVVMEGRSVLVAVAGRRDGARVYASEELRRAVEWRIDVESLDRNGSTTAGGDKKFAALPPDNVTLQDKGEAALKSAPSAGAKEHTHKRNLTSPLVGAGDPGGPTTTNPVAPMSEKATKST